MGRILAAIAMSIAVASASADDMAYASFGDTELSAGDDVRIDEPVDGNLFVAAGRVEVAERVGGSAWLTGGDVRVLGQVGRHLNAAGGDLRIEGEVEGRTRAAGGKIHVSSSARLRDRASFAGGTIEVDGKIDGRLRAYGETVVINGTVDGDVDAAGERIRIGPDARISGRLKYRSGSRLDVDPTAEIAEGVKELEPGRRWLHGLGHGARVFGGITLSFGMVLLGALLILAAPRFTREAAGTVRSKPWQSAGTGFLMLCGIPLAIILLLITVIGIPLALLVVFGYVVLLLLGYLVSAIFVGDLALARVGEDKLAKSWWRVLFMFLAMVAIAIVEAIPVVGGLAVFLLFIAGIGAFTMRSWQGFRRDPDAPAGA